MARTQFIKNAWYVAAWSSEIIDAPQLAKIIGEPLVLFRKTDGEIVALSDTCPHRFAPLHMGKVIDDVIECGYHGLRFGASGKCVHNPVGNGAIPSAARVRSFAVVERDSLIWVWMGAAELADPGKIIDFPWLNDRDNLCMTADHSMHQSIYYELIIDNLLDLAHGAFLHPTTLGSEAVMKGKTKIRQDGDRIYYDRWNPDGEPATLFTLTGAVQPGTRVDYWNDMRWDAPGNFYLEVGVTETGCPRDKGHYMGSVHLLTPVDEETTIYRWILFRNFAKSDDGITKSLEALVNVAFRQEDEPMVKAVHQRMAGRDFWDMEPLILPGDKAAILARRTISRLLESEADLLLTDPVLQEV
ncbi:aromatic ring-hydroxylating dioxygenase subunit alpha [Govanella unica]|uniref:Aromatic ring-hydroxylating dioxygenase subunit alpha n=1 Tax=Govanella unica TaxID=2975056 RepID=A0A9X3Z7G3_9PROT|nr:aromatic ring-hydroxylating dioxygenase subunit alpha [Govania unica]MDA5194220.1 aromatic ring-hydroxylating dioxygenase subunit alpha [Govania unica]